MLNPVAPKIMAMHDLCSYGRSSLNVVAPLLTAVGCHCCALPTALLSSHFGFASSPSVLDLSDELLKIYQKWHEMDLHFEVFYSGYLASPGQVSIAKQFIDRFKPAYIYIDPVLGDNGKLYPAFNSSQVDAMRTLLKEAHIASPNLTEANALLALPLDTTFPPFDQPDLIKEYLKNLSHLGPATVIVTGIANPSRAIISSYLYDSIHDRFFKVDAPFYPSAPKGLHGTGDSFASIVLGRLQSGSTPQHAVADAMHFLSKSIEGAIAFNEEIAIEYAMSSLTEQPDSTTITLF
jgi:pyridoxine kinase